MTAIERLDITFRVPGEPVPWAAYARGFRLGAAIRANVYIRPEVKAYEAAVARAALAAGLPYRPALCPALAARIWWVFRCPRSTPKRLRDTWCHRITRPDGDKLERAVMDGLGQVLGTDACFAHVVHARLVCPRSFAVAPLTLIRVQTIQPHEIENDVTAFRRALAETGAGAH